MNIEKLSVPIAIVIAGGLIAGAFYYSNLKAVQNSHNQVVKTDSSTSSLRPISSEDHIIGNPNADVILVEYSDTECPFCKDFHTSLKRMMTEYGSDGKVAWVYRHFPIDALHPKSRKEAEALECASELGGPAKFWEYTNMIYDITTSNDTLDPSQLPKIAKSVGLDVTAFNTCLSSGKYAAKVQADYDNAIKIGGRGTPTSVILTKDGTKTLIEGAQPYDSLKAIIDASLK
ncbi:DsbA family protein [Patescibacteria group bacterium]|nr:DsbA family protein [Patescibacteria group bacterium]